VTARAAEPCLQQAALLLRDLDRVEAAAGDRLRERAELAERVPDAGERLRPLLREEAGSVEAAGLLVGDDREHEVALQR